MTGCQNIIHAILHDLFLSFVSLFLLQVTHEFHPSQWCHLDVLHCSLLYSRCWNISSASVSTSQAVAYQRGGGDCSTPPPPKFQRPYKIVPNSIRLWKRLKIAEFRTPTTEDVPKKGSKILKLLPVRNCFTLVMTNKLVVIINSLKVPKIKKILLCEMKFLVPNYGCLHKPCL